MKNSNENTYKLYKLKNNVSNENILKLCKLENNINVKEKPKARNTVKNILGKVLLILVNTFFKAKKI